MLDRLDIPMLNLSLDNISTKKRIKKGEITMNANDYVMNETIMNDLVEQLKGNPKALDIMTDFCTAFMYMLMYNKDFDTDTIIAFQNDVIQRLKRRYDYEEVD